MFSPNFIEIRKCDRKAREILSCDKNERIYQKLTQRVTFAFKQNGEPLIEILEALAIARKRGPGKR